MSLNSANRRQRTKHVIKSSLEDDLTDEEGVDHFSKENDTSGIFVHRKTKVYNILETCSKDESFFSLDGCPKVQNRVTSQEESATQYPNEKKFKYLSNTGKTGLEAVKDNW